MKYTIEDLIGRYVRNGTPEAEVFLDACEALGVRWVSGRRPRENIEGYPHGIFVDTTGRLRGQSSDDFKRAQPFVPKTEPETSLDDIAVWPVEPMQHYRGYTHLDWMRHQLCKALQMGKWDEPEAIKRAVELAEPLEELRDLLGVLKGESLSDMLSIALEQLKGEYRSTGVWDGIEPLLVGHIVAQGTVEYVWREDVFVSGEKLHVSEVKPVASRQVLGRSHQ